MEEAVQKELTNAEEAKFFSFKSPPGYFTSYTSVMIDVGKIKIEIKNLQVTGISKQTTIRDSSANSVLAGGIGLGVVQKLFSPSRHSAGSGSGTMNSSRSNTRADNLANTKLSARSGRSSVIT